MSPLKGLKSGDSADVGVISNIERVRNEVHQFIVGDNSNNG